MSSQDFDLFKMLDALSVKSTTQYDQLSEEGRKKVQPLVIMRWLTCTTNKQQVYMLNEHVNPYVFSLYNHKDLLMHLMATATAGSRQRYNWLKQQAKQPSKKVSVEIIKEYLHYTTKQAADAIRLLSQEDILDMAAELGTQADDIAAINKEWQPPKQK